MRTADNCWTGEDATGAVVCPGCSDSTMGMVDCSSRDAMGAAICSAGDATGAVVCSCSDAIGAEGCWGYGGAAMDTVVCSR